MISKKTFVNTIERLEIFEDKVNAVDEALRDLSPDFGGIYLPQPTAIMIDLLSEMFKDEEGWLSYFIYERDWLLDFKLGDIMINDEKIKIENWEDVYDFLIKNMEE
jgi:hypothetical protein|nr:MAG TPA_asm: hypothetical protein [Caudoviricetes sp.]